MRRMMISAAVVAAMMTMTSCRQRGDEPTPPTSPTKSGVLVEIEYVDSETGAVTRAYDGYDRTKITGIGGGGEVEIKGLGYRELPAFQTDIDVPLEFSAQQNVIFQKWEWRYADSDDVKVKDKSYKVGKTYLDVQEKVGTQPLDRATSDVIHVQSQGVGTTNVKILVYHTKAKKPVKDLPVLDFEILNKSVFRSDADSWLRGLFNKYTTEAERQAAIGKLLRTVIDEIGSDAPNGFQHFFDGFGDHFPSRGGRPYSWQSFRHALAPYMDLADALMGFPTVERAITLYRKELSEAIGLTPEKYDEYYAKFVNYADRLGAGTADALRAIPMHHTGGVGIGELVDVLRRYGTTRLEIQMHDTYGCLGAAGGGLDPAISGQALAAFLEELKTAVMGAKQSYDMGI